MKVVILCGGKGTRLREESEYRPKPLVEIGERPVLWHIMKLYAHHGFRDFVMCLGYKGNMIKEYFLNYDAFNNDFSIKLGQRQEIAYRGAHDEKDFSVMLSHTGADTLTGGRIKRIAKYLDGDTFMVTYGDGVSDVDIKKLIDFHHSHGKIATITTVQPTSRFGIMEFAKNGRVTSFAEKPQTDGWASAGFFVFDTKLLAYLHDSDACALEQEPLKRLAADGELMAYRHEGFFFAMDTYREYLYLNDLWEHKEAPWAVWDPSRLTHVK